MASQVPAKKNTAYTLYFSLFKSDGTVITNPGTYTKKISKDGGALADISASVTEIDTTYGLCSLVISATEMNADAVWIYIKDDTVGCVPLVLVLYTSANLMDDIKTDTAAIKTQTDKMAFTVANKIDANTLSVGGTTQTAADLAALIGDVHATDLPAVKTVVDAIKAKTDNLPAAPAAVGSEMTLTAAYDAAKTAASQASVNTIDDFLDTEIAAILADTNELQTDLANGGRLDLLIDAIKAKTDNLPAAPAAVGSAMTLTVAYDAAKSAASQTSVNAIPVNPLLTNDARLNNLDAAISSRSSQTSVDTVDGIVDAILEDTAQIGSAGAGLTAIPWNAAWDDEVQSECTDALNAYDPPTATELTAGLSAIPAAVWNYLLSAMSTVGSVGLRLAQWLTIVPADATAYRATDLSICNNALVQLGNEPLLNLTDTTKKAVRLCVQFYDQTVEEVLRAYNWNCATVRDTLTVDETAPAWGFNYRYALPADCLRVIGFSSASVNWKIENGYILADSDGGEISYIKLITAADMDALLRSAVSARLAAYLAFPLTNSATIAKAMFDLYKEKLADAHTMDAFENGTGEHLASDSWIHARGQ